MATFLLVIACTAGFAYFRVRSCSLRGAVGFAYGEMFLHDFRGNAEGMPVRAGKLLEIEVLDHLIIGQGRYVSMKEKNLGFEG